MKKLLARIDAMVLLAVLIIPVLTLAKNSEAEEPWEPAQVITAEALRNQLADSKGPRPLIIHVGFRTLYEQGHIPGSAYYGPASSPAGLAEIKKQVEKLPRSKAIVLYCGCCPWHDCPNIRPAFKALKALGFLHLKVLSLPTSFAADWAAKGYPVEKGK